MVMQAWPRWREVPRQSMSIKGRTRLSRVLLRELCPLVFKHAIQKSPSRVRLYDRDHGGSLDKIT